MAGSVYMYHINTHYYPCSSEEHCKNVPREASGESGIHNISCDTNRVCYGPEGAAAAT